MTRPVRIGVLDDLVDAPPSPSDVVGWLELAVGEVTAAGRVDREVEIVQRCGLGLPTGTAAAVERAYAALVDEDVLLIVGPAIGDNALVATPLAERHRVPTINWAGTERARGEYMFHLQVGSHEDESIVLARHLSALGAARVAVAYDRSPIGRRHLDFLDAEADLLGLRIVARAPLSPLATDAAGEVAELLEAGPDALVYLGVGLSAAAVARALIDNGWAGPRLMNTAGLRGYQPEMGRVLEGWIYVDMFADDNATLAELRGRPELVGRSTLALAKGYDLGRLAAEAIARADELTRDGVRRGLELIKWLPAAEGHDGTLLGFGHHDRGALHGRYLVLRQWREGASIQVAEAP